MGFSTPRSTYKAFQEGLKRTTKPDLSAQEINDRKAAIDKNITDLLQAQARVKKEIVEQYGTVRTSKEQTINQLKKAAIEAQGEMTAAGALAKGDIISAQIDELAGKAYDIQNGTPEAMKQIETFGKRIAEETTAVWEPKKGAVTVKAYVEKNIDKVPKYAEEARTAAVSMMTSTDSVAYKKASQNIIAANVQAELQPYVDSGHISAGDVEFAIKQLTPPELLITKEERAVWVKQQDLAVETMQKTLSPHFPGGRLPANMMAWMDEEPPENFTLEAFIKDLGAVPGVKEIEDTIAEFKAEKAGLDKPQLTPYGQFQKDYLAHPKEQYLTELLGFRDPTEAAFLYGSNPNALETALRTTANVRDEAMEAWLAGEQGEGINLEAARLEVAKQLGISPVGKRKKISPLRLRMAMIRSRPVGEAFETAMGESEGIVSEPVEAEVKKKDPVISKPVKKPAVKKVTGTVEEKAIKTGKVEAGKIAAPKVATTAAALNIIKGIAEGRLKVDPETGLLEEGVTKSVEPRYQLSDADINILAGVLQPEEITNIKKSGVTQSQMQHYGMSPEEIEAYALYQGGKKEEFPSASTRPPLLPGVKPKVYDTSLVEFGGGGLPKKPSTKTKAYLQSAESMDILQGEGGEKMAPDELPEEIPTKERKEQTDLQRAAEEIPTPKGKVQKRADPHAPRPYIDAAEQLLLEKEARLLEEKFKVPPPAELPSAEELAKSTKFGTVTTDTPPKKPVIKTAKSTQAQGLATLSKKVGPVEDVPYSEYVPPEGSPADLIGKAQAMTPLLKQKFPKEQTSTYRFQKPIITYKGKDYTLHGEMIKDSEGKMLSSYYDASEYKKLAEGLLKEGRVQRTYESRTYPRSAR